jgi:mannose-1-phosphate guanylyltransferase
MKAIILSAGYGTRLRPLTDRLPKPLVPILGTPILSHIIRRLKECNVSDIGVNIHHKFEIIEEYLETNHAGKNITLSFEKDVLGVAGGIGGFREFLKGESLFIVHNGDILSNIRFSSMVPDQKGKVPLCTMIVHDYDGYNNVAVDEQGNVLDIRRILRPDDTSKMLAYTGISYMSGDILNLIPEGVSHLVPILLDIIKKERGMVMAVDVKDCAWMDVGTIENYFSAHKEILVNKKPLIAKDLVPEKSIFFGKNSVVGEGVEFSGFISAGRDSVFKKGCRIENCVVWDNAVVEENAVIKNSVIGKGWIVDGNE